MNKILVVNVNWLGDVIFSLPVFKALKKAYPNAFVSCLAPPRVKEILESSPDVDQIIVYDEQGFNRGLWGKLKLIAELRREKFDIAFLLHRSLTRALLVFLAGIPKRIGYDTKKRGFLLTHPIKPLTSQVHRMDSYLHVLESFGIKVEDRTYQLEVDDFFQNEIDYFLGNQGVQANDFLVVVNSGGNWDLKRWPKENFAQLIKRLVHDFKAKVVIPGGKKDVTLAQEISDLSQVHPIILAGETGIKQLLALMKRSQLVISGDTGPLHLASSVGTRVIGLFGPTRPETTGVRGRAKFTSLQKDVGCNREPCYYLACPHNVCMQSITVEDVIKEVRRIKDS